MSKIHVLPDENLGGGPNGQILREYVEVDRPAKEDDLIIFRDDGYDITAGRPYRVVDSRSYTDVVVFIDDADKRYVCENPSERFFVIEPTDIVHINGERYRLVDRKAKVGEKVIIVKNLEYHDWFKIGEIAIVEEVDNNGNVFADFNENKRVHGDGKWCVGRNYYRVIEPVEPAEKDSDLVTAEEGDDKSVLDLLANLARRVTELEKIVKKEVEEGGYFNGKLIRIEDEINTLVQKFENLESRQKRLIGRIADTEEKLEKILDDIVTLDERTQPLAAVLSALVKAVKADE
jgi:hypothetical protein